MLSGILAGTRGDFGGKQVHDWTVLVRCPNRAVQSQEARPSAFLSPEAEGTVEQAGHEPFEAHWDLAEPTAKLVHDVVDHAAAHQRLAHSGVDRPVRPIGQQVADGDSKKM